MATQYTGTPGSAARQAVSFDTGLRDSLDAPAGYLAAPNLVTAVNAAMLLGQPLLLNGEPGTGKSGLSGAVAHELALGPVLRINCKADMRSGDLFYTFDHTRRLYDASAGQPRAPESYVSLQGLGVAIARAAGAMARALPLHGSGEGPVLGALFPGLLADDPVQSVVLIDEIDKASRDVPNDILVEIDAMRFDIPELGLTIAADTRRKPFVVITSNSEKALPAPFLRRCVFYTIPFPALPGEAAEATPGRPAYTLENIVTERISGLAGSSLLAEGLQVFARLRDPGRFETRPSPAEFMNWLLYLRAHRKTDFHLRGEPDLLRKSLVLLLKSERDRQVAAAEITKWLAGSP